MKRFLARAVVVLLFALPSVMTVLPAGASTAPTCVTYKQNFWGTVTVHNWCSYRVRVKVVVRAGNDSTCIQLASGQTHSFWTAGRVDRLENC